MALTLSEEVFAKVANARGELFATCPSIYGVMTYVKSVHENNTIDTMHVWRDGDGSFVIEYNVLFATSLSAKQLQGVLLHEMLHIIMKHIDARLPSDIKLDDNDCPATPKDVEKLDDWNIACDLSINQFLKGYLEDPDGRADLGIFPDQYHFDNGHEAEYYYKKLSATPKKSFDTMYVIGKGCDSHDAWKNKPEQKPEDIPVTEQIDKEIKSISNQVASGTGSGSDRVINIDIPEEKSIPDWVKSLTNSSVGGFDTEVVRSRKKRNRRYGFTYPGVKRVIVGRRILVFVDVSGSISDSHYTVFMKHINYMSHHCDFDILPFGDEVQEKRLVNIKKFSGKLYIGGGTNFDHVMKYWEKHCKEYSVNYIFTDGKCTQSYKPKCPTNAIHWVVYGNKDHYDLSGNVHIMKLS